MKILAVILLLLTSLIVSDELARIRVGKRFVDNIVSTFLPQAVKQINGLSGKDYGFDVFGLHLNASNLTFDEVTLNRSQYNINFNPSSSSIDIEINNLNINAKSLVFHKLLFFSKASGVLNADMKINLMLSISLTSDRYGTIQLGLNNYNFNYRGSKISFKGGFFEWNVQLWLNTFEFMTEFIIRQVLKYGINSALASINSNLQNQLTIPSTGSSVQIKASDSVKIDNNHIDLSTKFLFKYNNTKKNLRMLAGEAEMDDTEDLKILINFDLMNAFSKAFYIDNIFSLQFTSQNIPDNIPFKINTKYFQHIIPGIYDKYPDQELVISLKASQQPSFFFNKVNQSVEFSTQALFNFALVSAPERSIFSFNSDIFLDVLLGSNYTDPSVHLTLNKIEIQKMSVVASEFPEMDIEKLRSNLNFTFEIICNAANKFYLVKGIPLPLINGLRFKKVVVQVEEYFFSLTIQPDVQTSDFSWLRLY